MQPVARRLPCPVGAALPAWQSRHVASVGMSTSVAASDRSAAWQVAQGVSAVPWAAWLNFAAGIQAAVTATGRIR
jgi:hypothetical protein